MKKPNMKTKVITLVLVCAALACCNKSKQPYEKQQALHLRSDTTAEYSYVRPYGMWWYAFRPYGIYSHGSYSRRGFYSGSIHESSNIGHSAGKSAAVRGGFGGRGGFGVSS